jgi:N-acetylneuraminic acid mutarotase
MIPNVELLLGGRPQPQALLRAVLLSVASKPATTVRLRRGLAATAMLAITFLQATTSQAQSGEWAWMSGASTSIGQTGNYGTLGVPSPSNVPGYRALATTWTDSSGNLWLFGGSAPTSATDGSIHLNDIWEFNPDTNQWTWMSGYDHTVGGVYGTLGVPAAANVPGARQGAMGWADSSGNLWLFGGSGYDSAKTFGILNDLWNFNPATKQWTWMGGSSTVPNTNDCQPGIYGTQGVASANNVPGGRSYAASWTDANGNFWLFGGPGCDSAGTQALLNDLWKFNPSTNQWAWMGGSSKALYTAYGSPGVYGTQGVASAANVPGGRFVSGGWTDSSGNLWLFGGDGYDSIGARGYLNDLWKFNPSTNEWTWVSGSSTLGNSSCYQPGIQCSQGGVYGTLGQPAAGNVPGGRRGAVGAIDANDNLWLFGGDNQVNGVDNLMNDLWKFNPQTRQWAWMSGSNTPTCRAKTSSGNCVENGEYGVYGTLRVSAPVNVPGSRDDAASWSDRNGHLWLFGGGGFDSVGFFWSLNDLWEYQLKQNSALALTSSANPVFAQNPITLTASVTATGATPTGTVTFLDGTTSIGTGTLNSSGSATLSVNNLTVGSHTITASYAGDTNNFAAANAPLTEAVEDFSIAAGATTTATIKSGSSATYTFTFNPIAPATTFPSALTLSASGGPAGSTYTLSPTTITSGAGSTPVTLTVAVPPNSGSSRSTPRRPEAPLSLPFALAALVMPLAGRLGKASKWTRGIASLLLIAAGVAASASLSGCSGGSSAAYTITVSGTAGALSHSTFVKLTVN